VSTIIGRTLAVKGMLEELFNTACPIEIGLSTVQDIQPGWISDSPLIKTSSSTTYIKEKKRKRAKYKNAFKNIGLKMEHLQMLQYIAESKSIEALVHF